MKKGLFLGISCVVLIFGLIFTGCPQPEPLSSDATLKNITIAGVKPLSLGTPSDSDWEAVVPGDIYLSASQLIDAKISVSLADGATVWYEVSPGAGVEPNLNANSTVTLAQGNIVWVMVYSANLDKGMLYAFNVHNRTPLLASAGISRNFTTAAGGWAGNQGFTTERAATLGAPATAWDAVTEPGELWVGTLELSGYDFTQANPANQSQKINFFAAAELPDSTLSYALASGTTEPVFAAAMPAITDAAGAEWLYIKSVSSDAEYGETAFYKIKLVEKNDDYSLSAITVGDATVDPATLVPGYHSLVGQEAWGSYYNGATLNVTVNLTDVASDVSVTATPTASTTKVAYGVPSGNVDYLIGAFGQDGNLGAWEGRKIVAIEITNELGEAAYHRFYVNRVTE